jgi:hypothetical protein
MNHSHEHDKKHHNHDNHDHNEKHHHHEHEKRHHEHDSECKIFVNSREKTFSGKMISYEQVVQLAFDRADNTDQTVYTVTYSKGDDKKPQGSLVPGDSVHVKCGMIFNVTKTDKS